MVARRVLIVENDASEALSLASMLSDDGCVVSWARDGYQALRLIHTAAPEVILVSLWLPGMDGLEILRALRSMRRDLPVIMLSGHGTIEAAVEALRRGASDFVEQPVAPGRLVQAVRQAVLPRQPRLSLEAASEQPLLAHVILGDSPSAHALRRQLEVARASDSPVLIQGEVGSEHEVVARLLHNGSARGAAPLLVLRGADLQTVEVGRWLPRLCTGPWQATDPDAAGLDAMAGTLLVDGLEALAPRVQGALLAAMIPQPYGDAGPESIPPDRPRLMVACHTSLDDLEARDHLAYDLLDAVRSCTLVLPPLRQRRQDIPLLSRLFLEVVAAKHARQPPEIAPDALELLRRYDWPENFAELRRVIRRLVLAGPGRRLDPPDVRAILPAAAPRPRPRRGRGARSAWRAAQASHQQTLGRSVRLQGQSLQSGQKTGMVLAPLPPYSGVVFCDLVTRATIPALVQYVDSTHLSTNLRRHGTAVGTVEHLLSVLHAYRVTNVLVKVDGELPIMDGSALDFCALIEDAGVVEQEAPLEEFIVDRCYRVGQSACEGPSLVVEPYDGLKITYRLEYPPPLGEQVVTYEHRDGPGYRREIAPARTFAFLRDVEELHERGLMAGGRLTNVILLDAGTLINRTRLRFPDECARHKVLDLMGDLCLLGKPLRGHVRANMTGHSDNIALVAHLSSVIREHSARQPGAGR